MDDFADKNISDEEEETYAVAAIVDSKFQEDDKSIVN